MEIQRKFNGPEKNDLFARVRKAGLSQLFIAYCLGTNQATINQMLRGYKAMPREIRQGILEIIEDAEARKY